MITFAQDHMVPNLKSLWKICFGDSDEYIDLYFRHRYRAPNTLVNSVGGLPVAMLTMLPVTAASHGMDVAARYIFAVATHPDHRRQGVGAALLSYAHDWMKNEGIALSILTPASAELFDFYGRHGYEVTFRLRQLAWEEPVSRAAPEARLTTIPSQLAALEETRELFFGSSRLFVRWDQSALSYLDMECSLLGGSTLAFRRGTKDVGYAICYPSSDNVLVKEFAIADGDLISAVAALQGFYSEKRLQIRLRSDSQPCADAPLLPFGMVKWHDHALREALQARAGLAPYLSLALD